MAGRAVKELESQKLLTAHEKTIVVFGTRALSTQPSTIPLLCLIKNEPVDCLPD